MAISSRSAGPEPSFGLVVPSLNQGRFLREALDSLFRQSYPGLEVIVMDGGSTDESLDVIRSFEDRLTYWQSEPDGGQSRAINEGVKRTSATLVGWLNSDDFHLGSTLRSVAAAYTRHPDFGLYIGNGFRFHEATGRYVPFCRRPLAFDRDALVHGIDYVLQPSAFFLRTAWEEVGGLDPELRYCMDWDVLIRVAKRHPVVLINEFLAVSREYAVTKTQSGGLERAFEIDAMVRTHTGGQTTAGSLYYLLETLLGLSGNVAPAGIERHVEEGLTHLRRALARRTGSEDGFPRRTHSRDRVSPGAGAGLSWRRLYRELTRNRGLGQSAPSRLATAKNLIRAAEAEAHMYLGRFS